MTYPKLSLTKIYIALIVQFRFKHCNGTGRGQKTDLSLIDHDSASQIALAPIRVANTLPSPLIAVLRMNSQAITQYCKVHRALREAAPRPAQCRIAFRCSHHGAATVHCA